MMVDEWLVWEIMQYDRESKTSRRGKTSHIHVSNNVNNMDDLLFLERSGLASDVGTVISLALII